MLNCVEGNSVPSHGTELPSTCYATVIVVSSCAVKALYLIALLLSMSYRGAGKCHASVLDCNSMGPSIDHCHRPGYAYVGQLFHPVT